MIFPVIVLTMAAAEPIADLRVGDDGLTARVVVVCGGPCEAEPMTDLSFKLRGVAADFSVDVSGSSDLLRRIDFASDAEGSSLTINAVRQPRSVTATPCGLWRFCFDIDLAQHEPSAARRSVSLETIEESIVNLRQRTGLTPEIRVSARIDTSESATDRSTLR